MALLDVNQLDKIGLNTDVPEYLVAPEAFTTAYNVSFANGAICNATGYRSYNTSPFQGDTRFEYVAGVADKLYFFNSGKLHLMTGTAIEYNVEYAQGFDVNQNVRVNALSNLPVIVNSGYPWYIVSPEHIHTMTKATKWGDNIKCDNVVAYKGYLFAFGLTIDGIRYEDTVMWSDVAAPDSYPKDWGFEVRDSNFDLAAPIKGSQGGYNQLNAVGGSILAAAEFGDHLYLFTETEIFRVSFIGGNQVFKFQKVLTGKGVVSTDGVITLENGLVVLGSNDLYLFNGQQSQSLANSRIVKYITKQLQQGAKVKMIRDFEQKDLIILWKLRDSDQYTEALVWNWVSNSFSLRDGQYTSFHDITEYRGDALFDPQNNRWKDYSSTPFSDANFVWQSPVKLGTGVLAIRNTQVLVYDNIPTIVDTEGHVMDIPWSFSRKLFNNAFGYEERGIYRLHTVKYRGTDTININLSINETLGTRRGDTVYFRQTGKHSLLQFFGNGIFNLPAYTIEHSFIGLR